MVRGYTPSFEGTAQKQVQKEIWKSFQEMEEITLVARMVKSLPKKNESTEVKAGDEILCLLPGGK